MTETIAQIRDEAAARLTPESQREWEQFLTPLPVAEQAAELFTPCDTPVRILDLGAGTGILGAVAAQHAARGSSVVAIEQDAELAKCAVASLEQVEQVKDNVTVINSSLFDTSLGADFNRVILNPPYSKMKPRAIATSRGDVKVTNAYAAFMVEAVQALAEDGECVAIIPRSWMNGEYFKDFRLWLLQECSLDAVAVYGSRQEHFKDMNILQEIMLVKVSRRPQTAQVTVYREVTPSLPLAVQHHEKVPLDSLVTGHSHVVRIQGQDPRLADFAPLRETGLWASTGKLVWFRNRDVLSATETEDGYPLYRTDNQRGLLTLHPVTTGREQWVTAEASARNLLLPAGGYCLVNRFSSKEQARRIHATYLHSPVKYAADNKLNYMHQGTSRTTVPLDDVTARGLTIWLSTTIVDEWYRQISGSTQVNATDLRELPCPSRKELAALADVFPRDGATTADGTIQGAIDRAAERLFSWTTAS